MRAAVLHAPRDLRVEAAAAPVPGAGEVVVRVAASGLCGMGPWAATTTPTVTTATLALRTRRMSPPWCACDFPTFLDAKPWSDDEVRLNP